MVDQKHKQISVVQVSLLSARYRSSSHQRTRIVPEMCLVKSLGNVEILPELLITLLRPQFLEHNLLKFISPETNDSA